MSRTVRLIASAEEDLRSARRWYLTEAPHLGADFRREVRATHDRIASNPRQYPEVYRKVRRALVHRFPFAVFYRIEAQGVQVVAIIHQARDPRVWRKRS